MLERYEQISKIKGVKNRWEKLRLFSYDERGPRILFFIFASVVMIIA
ncbi:hypothetical protein LCGC14_2832180, partial [marine sediment metagenome]